MINKEGEIKYAPRIYKRMPWRVRRLFETSKICATAFTDFEHREPLVNNSLSNCSLERFLPVGRGDSKEGCVLPPDKRENTKGDVFSPPELDDVSLSRDISDRSNQELRSTFGIPFIGTPPQTLSCTPTCPTLTAAKLQSLSFTERVRRTLAFRGSLSNNHVIRVAKFVFDPFHLRWQAGTTVIRVRRTSRPLGRGGMRECFLVEEVTQDATNELFCSQMVGKRFIRKYYTSRSQYYYRESEMQSVCNIFASYFNQAMQNICSKEGSSKSSKQLDNTSLPAMSFSFIPSVVIRVGRGGIPPLCDKDENCESLFLRKSLSDSTTPLERNATDGKKVLQSMTSTSSVDPFWFSMEPHLPGDFTKYNNNCGSVYATSTRNHLLTESEANCRCNIFEAAEAFSHFTLADSGGQMLVCDLQGVGTLLTDPQIHTVDGNGFGLGNMGHEGICLWIRKHTCNKFCRALQLPTLLKCSIEDERQSKIPVNLFQGLVPSSRHAYERIQAFCSRHGSLGIPISNALPELNEKDSHAPWRFNGSNQCTVGIPNCYAVG